LIAGREQSEDRRGVDEDAQKSLPVVPESFLEIGVVLSGNIVGAVAIRERADQLRRPPVEIAPFRGTPGKGQVQGAAYDLGHRQTLLGGQSSKLTMLGLGELDLRSDHREIVITA
jgi:hypothetical protein